MYIVVSNMGIARYMSDSHIARMFLNEVRENLEINPKVLQDQIQLRYDLNPSNDQCRKEKKKAFDLIQDQYNKKFRKIKDNKIEIKK